VRIDQQPGGMHLILRLKGNRSDRRLAASMREHSLYAEALTDWTERNDGNAAAIFLNFTNVDSRRTAENLGRRIFKLMTAA
jgi:GntR family transcriptional regulator / MocR family aminotransferase